MTAPADGATNSGEVRRDRDSPAKGVRLLTIGLVNNMSDAALRATERQFLDSLREAGGEHDVRLRLLSLPGIERSPAIQADLQGRYVDADEGLRADLDGLIVTGAEPRTEDLRGEAYWPALEKLVDWTTRTATPVIWSCLAAHAAVLALDRVPRRRFAEKRSGVFPWRAAPGQTLLSGLPEKGATPHSSLHDVAESDIEAAGYTVLTRFPGFGVDAFAKTRGGLHTFLLGHPEYEADSLIREYRRDLLRWIRGGACELPHAPHAALPRPLQRRFAAVAAAGRGDPDGAAAAIDAVLAGFQPTRSWSQSSHALFTAWLRVVAQNAEAHAAAAAPAA